MIQDASDAMAASCSWEEGPSSNEGRMILVRLVQEGQIVSDFEGWSGETVFEFDNGVKWQQATYSYNYYYSYRPRAKVWQDGSRFFLEVQGISTMLEVRRHG